MKMQELSSKIKGGGGIMAMDQELEAQMNTAREGKRLEQLKEELKHNHFTLVEVIDAVVEINGIIGVGLISLGDDLKNYCYQKAGDVK